MPGLRSDLDQQRHLTARDAEGVELAPELAAQAQQHRAQPVGDGGWVGGDR